MNRWYGKLLGALAGAVLFRPTPVLGAVLGLLLGHAFDRGWFGTRPAAGEDPYAVFGLASDASDAQVEQAWRRRMSQCHPDRVAGAAPALRAQAEARARQANAAYDRIRALRGQR